MNTILRTVDYELFVTAIVLQTAAFGAVIGGMVVLTRGLLNQQMALYTQRRIGVAQGILSFNNRYKGSVILCCPLGFEVIDPLEPGDADINQNDMVDIFDPSIVLGKWEQTSGLGGYDINGDVVVNIFDLGKLLNEWGK